MVVIYICLEVEGQDGIMTASICVQLITLRLTWSRGCQRGSFQHTAQLEKGIAPFTPNLSPTNKLWRNDAVFSPVTRLPRLFLRWGIHPVFLDIPRTDHDMIRSSAGYWGIASVAHSTHTLSTKMIFLGKGLVRTTL